MCKLHYIYSFKNKAINVLRVFQTKFFVVDRVLNPPPLVPCIKTKIRLWLWHLYTNEKVASKQKIRILEHRVSYQNRIYRSLLSFQSVWEENDVELITVSDVILSVPSSDRVQSHTLWDFPFIKLRFMRELNKNRRKKCHRDWIRRWIK